MGSGVMDNDLGRFIRHARERGLDYATIRTLLLEAGWKDEQVGEALVGETLDMPVPRPVGGGSAKDTFVDLFSFTALYAWVISLLTLLFTCIGVTWPDPAAPVYSYTAQYVNSTIRWSLATIVVAYPVFLLMWRHFLGALARDPKRRQGRAYRWLTYLSLFVASATVLTDLITFVYYAFEGDLTLRFLLKVLVLFVVSGTVFVYLALTLRDGGEAAS